MLRKLLILLISALFMLSACSAPAAQDKVSDAVTEFGIGNLDRCNKICNEILADSATLDALSVGQLCTLSQLFVRLNGDIEANDAQATLCLSRATRLAPDSVEEFIKSQSAEVSERLITLRRVDSYMAIHRDSLIINDIPEE